MKVKTSDLTGAALDWAVAKCVYGDTKTANGLPMFVVNFGYVLHHTHKNGWKLSHASLFNPTANWSQGGPIIEREKLQISPQFLTIKGWLWVAYVLGPNNLDDNFEQRGPTPLIAAMRCYVASKMGEEIEIPEGNTTDQI